VHGLHEGWAVGSWECAGRCHATWGLEPLFHVRSAWGEVMRPVKRHPFWSEMRHLNRGRFLAQVLAPKRCPPTVGGHSLWPIFWSRTRPLIWCRVSVSVQTLVRRQWRGSSYIALSCILKYRCCFSHPPSPGPLPMALLLTLLVYSLWQKWEL